MSPRRAWWVTPVDALLTPAERLRRTGFDDMRRAAAGDAEPDGEFDDGMRVLFDSLMAAPLSPIGRAGAREDIGRRITNRYDLRRLQRRHPEVARPVIVTGLPRTGTTLLHGVLARHEGARAPVPALSSWCGFVDAVSRLSRRHVDPAAIGPQWLAIWEDAVTRARRVRAAAPQRFVDVGFDDLAADRLGVASGVWAEPVGGPRIPAQRIARHHPERYSLDPDEVRARLS